jgi:ribosomal protein L12E/L44/L45/RPP1/RPP2
LEKIKLLTAGARNTATNDDTCNGDNNEDEDEEDEEDEEENDKSENEENSMLKIVVRTPNTKI